jgi:hypothetical protein
MLWKVAIHSGRLHPDFIRDELTEKQLYEIAWYYEVSPFGYEIDHLMMSRLICAMAGGKEADYMPTLQSDPTEEEQVASMPGLSDYMGQYGIELNNERD